jgi:hypothetical protein
MPHVDPERKFLTLREKQVNISAVIVGHGCYVIDQTL